MAQIRSDTIGGVNTFLKSQQETPGECTFTLVQFDSTAIETIVDAQPIKSIAPFTEKTFVPRNGTPLYDAIGQNIGIGRDRTMNFMANPASVSAGFAAIGENLQEVRALKKTNMVFKEKQRQAQRAVGAKE